MYNCIVFTRLSRSCCFFCQHFNHFNLVAHYLSHFTENTVTTKSRDLRPGLSKVQLVQTLRLTFHYKNYSLYIFTTRIWCCRWW